MTMILTNPIERTRFLKFAAVGVVGAIVDFGTFNLLSTILHVNPVISSIISFGTAVGSNFLWNRYWIYPETRRAKSFRRQGAQFALVNFVGFLIRTPLFAFLEQFLKNDFLSLNTAYGLKPNFLEHNLALAISVIAVMLWNFFINRYWTYNSVDKLTVSE